MLVDTYVYVEVTTDVYIRKKKEKERRISIVRENKSDFGMQVISKRKKVSINMRHCSEDSIRIYDVPWSNGVYGGGE